MNRPELPRNGDDLAARSIRRSGPGPATEADPLRAHGA